MPTRATVLPLLRPELAKPLGPYRPARLSDKLAPMRRGVGILTLVMGAVGLVLLAVGIVYLTVECHALPGILGPTHGDMSPRTKLGVVGVVLGLVVLLASFVAARRRPPMAPRHR